MHYNRENTRLKFSTDQYIDEATYSDMMAEYNQLVKDVLMSGMKDFRTRLDGEPVYKADDEEDPSRKPKMIVGSIIAVAFFAALIIALFMRNLVLFGYMFCGIFLFTGIMLIVTGRSGNLESASASLSNRIWGIFIVAMSGTIMALIFLRDSFSSSHLFLWIAVVGFGLSGIMLLAVMITNAAADKLIYKEEIDAKCIGYVRKVDRVNDNDSGPSYPYMFISPVFDYTYDGVRYESIYDSMVMRRDSDVELNSYTTIHIDPKHPEGVMSPNYKSKGGGVVALIMSIAFIAAAGFMTYMVVSGMVSDDSLETSWNPALESEETVVEIRVITDESIEQNYSEDINGKDWYVEEITVSEIDPSGSGYSINFGDMTFIGIYLPADQKPEIGTHWLAFYTIDEESLENANKWFKDIFVYADTSEFQYSGSHGQFTD